MIHDTEMRPAILNASKLIYDKDVRATVRRYAGQEYKTELIPWLQGVANSANMITKNQMAMARLGEYSTESL